MIVDLTKTEEEILARMHSKTRYNINLAAKKELRIKKQEVRMGEFWELLEKTAKRDEFFLHPKQYYEELMKMPEVKLFGVYLPPPTPPILGGEGRGNAQHIATAMVSFWGDTATYLHGASDYEYRAVMAPYLLHWEIMKQAKAAGMKHYDFGGVAPQNEPDHFLAGVTRFKSGWEDFNGKMRLLGWNFAGAGRALHWPWWGRLLYAARARAHDDDPVEWHYWVPRDAIAFWMEVLPPGLPYSHVQRLLLSGPDSAACQRERVRRALADMADGT